MFTVAKTQPIVGYKTEPGSVVDPTRCLTYRTDTGEPLGVVGTGYEIMQPQECSDLVAQVTGNDNVETIWDGKCMITQAPMKTMLLGGDDEVKSNFTVVNSFNGGTSLHGLGISFRMFCANQLNMAFDRANNSGTAQRIRHSGDWDSKVVEFTLACEAMSRSHERFKDNIKILAERRDMTAGTIRALFEKAAPIVLNLGGTPASESADLLKVSGFKDHCDATFQSERSQGAPESMWLVANSITKYVQHSFASKGRKTSENRRFVDNAVGPRSTKSSQVMRAALELV